MILTTNMLPTMMIDDYMVYDNDSDNNIGMYNNDDIDNSHDLQQR